MIGPRAQLVLVVFAVLCIGGCSDSGEVRLQQLRIAINGGSPQQALDMADELLAERSDVREVWLIKARAELQLQRFDACQQSIERLLMMDPEAVEVSRMAVALSLQLLDRMLQLGRDESTKRFVETMTWGQASLDALEARGEDPADVAYHRARFEQANALRNPANSSQHADAAIRYLQRAVAADARHFEAYDLAVRLMEEQQRWSELAALIERLAMQPKLPQWVTRRAVITLVSMPHSPGRVALGRSLLQQVLPTERRSVDWRLSSARLHMLADEHDLAQALFESILEERQGEHEVRFLLGQSLYYQRQYDAALTILKPLSNEAKDSAGVQMFYGLTLARLGRHVPAGDAIRRAIALDFDDIVAKQAARYLEAADNEL